MGWGPPSVRIQGTSVSILPVKLLTIWTQRGCAAFPGLSNPWLMRKICHWERCGGGVVLVVARQLRLIDYLNSSKTANGPFFHRPNIR